MTPQEQNNPLTTIREIRLAVRHHRDQKGDYRCWVDDVVLYHSVLPELREHIPTVPHLEQFLGFCNAYFHKRQDPLEPISDIPIDSRVGPLELRYDSFLDADLSAKTLDILHTEVDNWYTAIRLHRDKGQMNRTYEDDQTLYMMLPERVRATTRLPARDLFLGNGCPSYGTYCQNHPDEFAGGRWE